MFHRTWGNCPISKNEFSNGLKSPTRILLNQDDMGVYHTVNRAKNHRLDEPMFFEFSELILLAGKHPIILSGTANFDII